MAITNPAFAVDTNQSACQTARQERTRPEGRPNSGRDDAEVGSVS